MKKGEGVVQRKINALLRSGGFTSAELALETGANRQYIRKVLHKLVEAGKVVTKGVASPQGGLTYKIKRKRG